MPVRTDRCPNCYASLPGDTEEFCVHCRQSLVPPGRKARREAEEARRSGVGAAPVQPEFPPPAPARRDDEPFTGTWRSVPIDELEGDEDLPYAPASTDEGLTAPAGTDAPGAASKARRPIMRSVLAGACVAAGLAAVVMAGTALDAPDRILSNEPAPVQEPVVHKGPTFSVRLPGPASVGEENRDGLTITTHRYQDGDSSTSVTVFEAAGGVPLDLESAVRNLQAELGGTQIATPVDVEGRAARDIQVSNAEDGRSTAFVRLVVDGPVLYRIQTVVEGDVVAVPADHRAAVNTFVIG